MSWSVGRSVRRTFKQGEGGGCTRLCRLHPGLDALSRYADTDRSVAGLGGIVWPAVVGRLLLLLLPLLLPLLPLLPLLLLLLPPSPLPRLLLPLLPLLLLLPLLPPQLLLLMLLLPPPAPPLLLLLLPLPPPPPLQLHSNAVSFASSTFRAQLLLLPLLPQQLLLLPPPSLQLHSNAVSSASSTFRAQLLLPLLPQQLLLLPPPPLDPDDAVQTKRCNIAVQLPPPVVVEVLSASPVSPFRRDGGRRGAVKRQPY